MWTRAHLRIAFVALLRRTAALALALLGCLVAGMATPALAQSDYPNREITLIVPFAAGGPTDVVARIVASRMSRNLSQTVVIENVVGSGGTTAAIRAMRSTPDGYTIIMGHMGTHAAAVALNPTLPYNPSTDFVPVGMIASMPVLILARKDFPARDLGEFVAYAHAHAAELKMGHAGVVSVSFATCQLLNSMIEVAPTLVAFQGTGPAMTAMAAGRIDYMCDQVVNVVPQIQANTIKAFAIATDGRNPALPGVPTTREAGLPGFRASAWNALFAPTGTPAPTIDRLNAALVEALDDEKARGELLALGCELPANTERTPQALARLVNAEIARWKSIIKPTGPTR